MGFNWEGVEKEVGCLTYRWFLPSIEEKEADAEEAWKKEYFFNRGLQVLFL